MGGVKILVGSQGHDARGIDVLVGHVIMTFDVIHIHRVSHSLILIKIFEIAEQMGIIDDAPNVAFEMPMIHRENLIQNRLSDPPRG